MLGSSCGAKEEHSGSAPCWPCGCSLSGSCPHFPSMFMGNESHGRLLTVPVTWGEMQAARKQN